MFIFNELNKQLLNNFISSVANYDINNKGENVLIFHFRKLKILNYSSITNKRKTVYHMYYDSSPSLYSYIIFSIQFHCQFLSAHLLNISGTQTVREILSCTQQKNEWGG